MRTIKTLIISSAVTLLVLVFFIVLIRIVLVPNKCDCSREVKLEYLDDLIKLSDTLEDKIALRRYLIIQDRLVQEEMNTDL